MKCQNCQAFVPDDTEYAFCPNCGATIPARSKRGDPDSASSAGKATVVIPSSEQPDVATPPAGFDLPRSASPSAGFDLPRSASSYPPAAQPTTVAPTSTAATVSLILGIVAWVFLPLFAAIGAVIAGHIARREIRDSGGYISGNGMAMAGLVLGYSQLVLLAVGICFVIGLIVLAGTA